jgi:Mn-dependent DtxR family transcriptional regulator
MSVKRKVEYFMRAKTANNLSGKGSNSQVFVQSESNRLSTVKVLGAISDCMSLALFKTIAITSDSTSNGQESKGRVQSLISCMNLTSSQYNYRIRRLKSLGLIQRKKGRYSITSYGRIIFEIQKSIEIAVQYRWRFVALDSFESSTSPEGMSVENRTKIMNALLEDHDEFKSIFLNKNGKNVHITK